MSQIVFEKWVNFCERDFIATVFSVMRTLLIKFILFILKQEAILTLWMRMNDFRSKSEIFKNRLKFCLLILLLYVEEKAILYWDILQVNFFFLIFQGNWILYQISIIIFIMPVFYYFYDLWKWMHLQIKLNEVFTEIYKDVCQLFTKKPYQSTITIQYWSFLKCIEFY